jgi:DNA-binding MarR family transcriptional regulator
MTKAKPAMRQTANVRSGNGSQGEAASAGETFPPLTTSIKWFVKNGSDREFRELIYDLTSLANLMLRGRKQFAAYIGVTEAQMLIMTIISEAQDATVGAIARQLNVTSQFVTIEIGELVKQGIVVKRPNEADRRSMFLNLTSKGRNLLRELAPLRRKKNDTTFRTLTEDRARILKDIVGDLISDCTIALHELEAPHLRNQKAPSAQSETKVRPGARRPAVRG